MATKTLYVGNLPYDANEDDLLDAFGAYGARHPRIIGDKGFAFIDVDADLAELAIHEKHHSDLGRRRLTVTEAQPRKDERHP